MYTDGLQSGAQFLQAAAAPALPRRQCASLCWTARPLWLSALTSETTSCQTQHSNTTF